MTAPHRCLISFFSPKSRRKRIGSMNIWVQSKRNVSRPSWTEPPKQESKVAPALKWSRKSRRKRSITRRSNFSRRRPHCSSTSCSPKSSQDVWIRRYRCLKNHATPPSSLSIILCTHKTRTSTEHTTINRSTSKTNPCKRTTLSATYSSKIATSSSASKLWNLHSSIRNLPTDQTNGRRLPKKRSLGVRVEWVLLASLRRKRSPNSCLKKRLWMEKHQRLRKECQTLIPIHDQIGPKRRKRVMARRKKRASKTRICCSQIRRSRMILRNWSSLLTRLAVWRRSTNLMMILKITSLKLNFRSFSWASTN